MSVRRPPYPHPDPGSKTANPFKTQPYRHAPATEIRAWEEWVGSGQQGQQPHARLYKHPSRGMWITFDKPADATPARSPGGGRSPVVPRVPRLLQTAALQQSLSSARHRMLPHNLPELAPGLQTQPGRGMWHEYTEAVMAAAVYPRSDGQPPHEWEKLMVWKLRCALTMVAEACIPEYRLKALPKRLPPWMVFFTSWAKEGEAQSECLVLSENAAARRQLRIWEQSGGYLAVKLGRRTVGGESWNQHSYMHRLVCWGMHGSRPNGHEVDHTCTNPGCVSGPHLQWATHAENMAAGAERRETLRERRTWWYLGGRGDNPESSDSD